MTDDQGTLIKKLSLGLVDKFRYSSDKYERFSDINLYEIENGGEVLQWMHFLYGAYSPMSEWVASRGVPNAMAVTDLAVGTRFYFNENSYIRIASKQQSGASPYIAWTVNYDYWKNGVKVGSLGLTLFADCIMPIFPWFYKNVPANYPYDNTNDKYSIIFNINTSTSSQYYTKLGFSSMGDLPSNLSWLKTYFDTFPPLDLSDPYLEIEDSEPSGPAEGIGYPDDELVPIPGLPSVSVTDTGFVTLFNPNLLQVKNLANYMWAGLFDLNTFKKIFADPMDCILGFNMLPVAIPNGAPAEVVVGNISTGVSMTLAASQWVELDCGSVTIDKPFGNYLDYAPYMKFSIYLPYIGTVDLSTDDIMGHTIHLVYHIDVMSCACVAYLEVDGRVMYQWTGSCGYSIPVTGENFRQMIANIVNIAANLGGAIATGGMTAPLAIASAASVTQNVMSSKPEVHRSGAIGSSAGMLGMQTPYLIQQGPKICKPQSQYHYLGYPAFVTVTLGDVSGYQEFSNVILSGIPCTEEERDMIAAACEGGIYL